MITPTPAAMRAAERISCIGGENEWLPPENRLAEIIDQHMHTQEVREFLEWIVQVFPPGGGTCVYSKAEQLLAKLNTLEAP